jgi:EmrB/QacA subfamily drug resistance transporter
MDLIDSTVVNVAAPKIAHDFHASSSSLQWIVGGYPLAIAVGLILGGRLGDLFGRKRMFIIGTVGFVSASILCGVAPGTVVLITARLIQGAFAAMMLPQGFGMVREVFPPDERQKAFSIFGPVIGLSSVFGPIIGGSIIDWNPWGTSWRFVFLINVPLGLAAIVGAVRFAPTSRRNKNIRLDLAGTAMVSAFAILLVYPLIQGREDGWPWWTYASMACGVIIILLFAMHQRRQVRVGKDPLVTPSVFAHRGYSGGLIFAVLFFAGLGGTLLCITLFLQIGQDFTPIHAALCTVPLSIGLVIGAGLSGSVLGPKFGRITLQVGVVVALVGWLLVTRAMGFHSTIGFVQLSPGLVVTGVGLGLIVAPMFNIILASVTDVETGSASGVLNAVQQLATSIGVAVLGTIFFDAISAGNFHNAFRRCLLVEVGIMATMLVVSPLLPRFERHQQDVSEVTAADETI